MAKKSTYRQFIATSVTASVAVTAVGMDAQAAETQRFTDVNTTSFAYQEILNLVDQGIIKGFTDQTFRPSLTIDRQQAAAFLARALYLEASADSNTFNDVSTSNIFYKEIAAVKEAGIFTGNHDGTFEPTGHLTREQMASVLVRAFELEGNTTEVPLKDLQKVSPSHIKDVKILYQNGITKGRNDGNFAPTDTINRAELSVFLYRALQLKGEEKFTLEQIKGEAVTIDGTNYKVGNNLKALFTSANTAILMNALLRFETDNDTITSITYLEITQSGTGSTEEFKNNLVLDAGDANINGNVKIASNFVSFKNMTIKGDLEIGSELANDFYSENLKVEGQTIINGGDNNTVVFNNANLGDVEVNKKGVKVDAEGSTTLNKVSITNDATLVGDVQIPEVQIVENAQNVVIDTNVTKVSVNTKSKATVSGTGVITSLEVGGTNEVFINTKGTIKTVTATKGSKIKVGNDTRITTLVLPEGTKLEDVVVNSTEAKIDQVKVGDKVSPGNPTPPPVIITPTPGPDQEVVNVKNLIAEIPETVTLAHEETVNTAQAAFGALSSSQKSQISSVEKEKLASAVQRINELKAQVDEVVQLITALPSLEALTLDHEDSVAAARAAYNALSSEQKARVGNDLVTKLENAEAKIAELKLADREAPVLSKVEASTGLSEGEITLTTNMNEAGTVYYVVVEKDAIAPTVEDVLAGTAYLGGQAVKADTFTLSTPDSDTTTTITGLEPGVEYDVYVLASDNETIPNVQEVVSNSSATSAVHLLNQSGTITGDQTVTINGTGQVTYGQEVETLVIEGNVTLKGDYTGIVTLRNLQLKDLIVDMPNATVVLDRSVVLTNTIIKDVSIGTFKSHATHSGAIDVQDGNGTKLNLGGNASNAGVTINSTGNVALEGNFNGNIEVQSNAFLQINDGATLTNLDIQAEGVDLDNNGSVLEIGSSNGKPLSETANQLKTTITTALENINKATSIFEIKTALLQVGITLENDEIAQKLINEKPTDGFSKVKEIKNIIDVFVVSQFVEELFEVDGTLSSTVTLLQIEKADQKAKELANSTSKHELLSKVQTAFTLYFEREAKQAVYSLYTDDSLVTLVPGITFQLIQKAEVKVKKLPNESTLKAELQDILVATVEKYYISQATVLVESLFVDYSTKAELAKGVTQELINAATVRVRKISNETTKTALTEDISKAQNLLNERKAFASIEKMVAGLFVDYTKKQKLVAGVTQEVLDSLKEKIANAEIRSEYKVRLSNDVIIAQALYDLLHALPTVSNVTFGGVKLTGEGTNLQATIPNGATLSNILLELNVDSAYEVTSVTGKNGEDILARIADLAADIDFAKLKGELQAGEQSLDLLDILGIKDLVEGLYPDGVPAKAIRSLLSEELNISLKLTNSNDLAQISQYQLKMKIVASEAPTITLTGSALIEMVEGGTFTDPGATARGKDSSDLTSSIEVTGEVDSTIAGRYYINYNVIDPKTSLSAATMTRTVVVKPKAATVVGSTGKGTVTVTNAHPLVEVLLFNKDNQLVSKGLTTDSGHYVFTNVPYGTDYTVVQVVNGVQGVPSAKISILQDTQAPTIRLNGVQEINLVVGESYLEEGATALDNIDGDLTSAIKIFGKVNTQQAGIYLLTYQVSDNAGNKAEITRTVKVAPKAVTAEGSIGKGTIKVTNVQPFATLNLYSNDGNLVDSVDKVNASGNHVFESVPVGTGYYVTQVVNGVESSFSNIVKVEADVNAPVIKLTGNSIVRLVVGDTFSDPGAIATDDIDGMVDVTITGNVDTSTPNKYELIYNAVDSNGNTASPVKRTVYVAPQAVVLTTSIGENEINVSGAYPNALLSLYNEAGDKVATGRANEEGVYTFTGIKYGTGYTVTQTVNLVESAKSVSVDLIADETAPVIKLIGAEIVTITLGEEYVDAGATATDDIDGDITDQIKVENNVDAHVPGQYTITYRVVDSSNNEASVVTRIVIVLPNVLLVEGSNGKGTVTVTGVYPSAKLELYNQHGELVRVKEAVTTDSYVFRNIPEGTYYVIQTINGVTTSTSEYAVVIGQPSELTKVIERFMQIYSNLSPEGQQAYHDAAEAIYAIEDWSVILGDLEGTINAKIDPSRGITAEDIVRDLAYVFYNSAPHTLEGNIESFRLKYSGAFDDIFGSQVTVNAMFTYFGALEQALWNHIDEAIMLLESPDAASMKEFARILRNEVELAHPELSFMDKAVRNSLGVELEELFMITQRLQTELEGSVDIHTLQLAFIQAIIKTGAPDLEPPVYEAPELIDVINRLKTIYGNLSETGKQAYNDATQAIIDIEDWSIILGDLETAINEKLDPPRSVTAEDIIKDLALVLHSSTPETLESNIHAFRTNYSAAFDDVFGTEVTVDAMLKYVGALEKALWNNIIEATELLVSPTPEKYKEFAKLLRDEVEATHPELALLDDSIRTSLGTGFDGLYAALGRLHVEIADRVDVSTMKRALIQAILLTGSPEGIVVPAPVPTPDGTLPPEISFTSASYQAETNTLSISVDMISIADERLDLSKIEYHDGEQVDAVATLGGTYLVSGDTLNVGEYLIEADRITIKLTEEDAQVIEALAGFETNGEVSDYLKVIAGFISVITEESQLGPIKVTQI